MILVTETGNRFSFLVRKNQVFHSTDGYFKADDIAGLEEGAEITSNTGRRGVILRPSLFEQLMSLPRRTQVTYPKDLGFILVLADIRPGSRVVEGGVGSGILAFFLSTHVYPNGRVYSYDIKDEMFATLAKQAERMGLGEVLALKKGDLSREVEETEVDAFIVDLPEPWTTVQQAKKALRGGGMFVSIVPTVEQLTKTCEALRASGFLEYFSGELMIRPWRVREGMTRPHHITRAHTVFIVAARNTLLPSLPGWVLRLPDGLR